eukprot:scaffold116337_cov32-Tisochrysis_lutea.AAC.1
MSYGYAMTACGIGDSTLNVVEGSPDCSADCHHEGRRAAARVGSRHGSSGKGGGAHKDKDAAARGAPRTSAKSPLVPVRPCGDLAQPRTRTNYKLKIYSHEI